MSSSYYSLARAFTASDFKLRYHDSAFGVVWSFLKPLILFSVLYTVFSVFMRFPIPRYGLCLLLGIIFWNFFVEATTHSIRSLLMKGPFIRKVHFPRTILVFSSTTIALMNLMVNLAVFAIFFALADVPLSWHMLYFPLWLAELYVLALGTWVALAALNARYRDVEHLWDVVVPMGFWVTPIVYSLSMVPEPYRSYFVLNPMASLIEGARASLLYGTAPDIQSVSLLTLLVACVAMAGYFIFRLRAPYFAEEL